MRSGQAILITPHQDEAAGEVEHFWVGPVAVRAATHVCAVIPNLLVQEFPGSRPDHAWTQELIDPPAEVRDGELVVPEGPGLGFSVDEKKIEKIRIG